MIKILLLIISLFVFLLLFILHLKIKGVSSILLKLCNIKIKINNPENLKYFNDEVILMSNHICSLDYFIINFINNSNKDIYTIAKDDIIDTRTPLYLLLYYELKKKLNYFNICNLIKYKIGDKNSGNNVRSEIVSHIKKNNLILVFPEGKTTMSGISENFKIGSFEVSSKNNIKVLPITISYNKNISNVFKKNYSKWIDTTATITIHKPIYHQDPEILRNLTYDIIVNPIKQKYKERNIIN
jgi:1-acyl-sn-glycerol-3-phosphate acyltransferase